MLVCFCGHTGSGSGVGARYNFRQWLMTHNLRGANAPRGSLKLARLPHAKGRLAARPQFAHHVSVAFCAQPFTPGELVMDWQEAAVVRRTYAKRVVNVVKAGNPRLEAAFAAISREQFLGPGPWQIIRNGIGPTEGSSHRRKRAPLSG